MPDPIGFHTVVNELITWTVHQLQETQAENTSDLEAAGRLASKARNAHNATMSWLRAETEAIEARKAEAEEEHTRWDAKHAMIQQKLEAATKDTHNITLQLTPISDRIISLSK